MHVIRVDERSVDVEQDRGGLRWHSPNITGGEAVAQREDASPKAVYRPGRQLVLNGQLARSRRT
jgi:hypothetical protein